MTAPTLPPAGWYADPEQPGAQRWWDGSAWLAQGASPQPQLAADPGYTAAPYPSYQQPFAPQGYVPPAVGQPYRPGTAGWGAPPSGGNRYAFITFGVVALYVVIAFATHFVIAGFIPFAMAFRSRAAREPLAIPAIVVASLGLVVGVGAFVLPHLGR